MPKRRPPAAAAGSAIVVRVAPPKYTAVAPFESAPRDLQVPEHSEVRWCAADGKAATRQSN